MSRSDRALPVLETPAAIRRQPDRLVALAAVAIAASFLAAAVLAVAAGAPGGPQGWLPIHLALAGGASTAIVGLVPYFASALVAGRPAGTRLRTVSVLLVAAGAAGVATRTAGVPGWLPVLGGTLFLTGVGATAVALVAAIRGGLVRRWTVVMAGYGLALANVAAGAFIGWLATAGWLPALTGWAWLRPAHAWFNVVGFVSVVIVATLLHFLPTVVGARIVERRTGALAVFGIGGGAALVAGGHVLAAIVKGVDPASTSAAWPPAVLARAGALAVLVGAAAVVIEAVTVVRRRNRWTSEAGWHALVMGSLLAGIAWFAAGIALAAGRVLALGASPDAWSSTSLAPALLLGWVVQVLVGSWSHLVPAIGPGGPTGHAIRRRILGRLAMPRLAVYNAGVAMLALGTLVPLPPALEQAGTVLVGGSLATSLALAAAALVRRIPPPTVPAGARPGPPARRVKPPRA